MMMMVMDTAIDDNDEASEDSINLIVDSRLRELAKGAREGYLKSHSYEEALEKRRMEAAEIEVPKLESLDDAYERVKGWIDSLVEDVSKDYYATTKNIKHRYDQEGDNNNSSNEHEEVESEEEVDPLNPKVYDIFALSHSALIRTVIHKMVDNELPSDYATTKEGSLCIPNLSQSIIDIQPFVPTSNMQQGLVGLCDTSVINGATKSSGPPYL